jgi:hypothetical protein
VAGVDGGRRKAEREKVREGYRTHG